MGDRVYPLLQALRVRGRRDAFIDEVMASFDASGSASSGALPLLPSATGRAHHGNAHLGDTHLAYTLMTRRELELKNMYEVSKLITESAFLRKGSVGAHYRSDYQQVGDGWERHITCKKGEELHYESDL
jgi:succinate dehydrogenase/fumarate reductase flavoprotein subunit